MTGAAAADTPALEIREAGLALGGRTLWSGLNLTVQRGEFVAVLGANGSGKTSLLRAILGQLPLDRGEIRVQGHPVRHGDRAIGYIPQQRIVPAGTALRGRDLVGLGLDGHRWGIPWPSRRTRARDATVPANSTRVKPALAPMRMVTGSAALDAS